MDPLLDDFQSTYPSLPLFILEDNGFVNPLLYEKLEYYICDLAIQLKYNAKLGKYVEDADQALYHTTLKNQIVATSLK